MTSKSNPGNDYQTNDAKMIKIAMKVAFVLVALIPFVTSYNNDNGGSNYLIGTGIYDMTGPAAQINFMGYAQPSQTGHGIHMRLRARAFIIAEAASHVAQNNYSTVALNEPQVDYNTEIQRTLRLRRRFVESDQPLGDLPKATLADPETTICFVSMDAGMGSDLLTKRVVQRLEELLPEQAGSSKKRLCHLENLSISGSHTHSAPAGFLQYVLYQVTSYGFLEEVMRTYVEGVAQALLRAYNSMDHGSITMAKDMLFNASINRSPSSYLLNPEAERNEYALEGNTDKTMLFLKFIRQNGELVGALNWFAVHGTSMNSSNKLISGDNKGYASYLLEKYVNGKEVLPGTGTFVAAFAATNLGDVSPNINGPRCLDSGLPCDSSKSTCNGRNELCVAFGPGKDMFESTKIIGQKQYDLAKILLQNATTHLDGPVAFRHSFVDMSNLTVVLDNGDIVHTCPAALGYSFAAGTTDGPGDFDFTQATNSSNPFWNMIGGFLSIPSKEQKACHSPKPILLNTGRARLPYSWDPDIVPISIFRVGNLFILSVPGEFTTMSGRRLRRAVREVLVKGGISEPVITIAGLSNSYTHYITTFEEYHGQRYEAASTLFGPHTLSAYLQEFRRITRDLVEGKPTSSDRDPDDLSRRQLSLVPPVELDTIGVGRKFGSVAIDAKDSYTAGNETAIVSFRSANPRNNQRIEGTFLTVDLVDDRGSWRTMYVDGDWCTKYIWKGGFGYFGVSFAEMHWEIPEEATPGIYRICHYGTRKTLLANFEDVFLHSPDILSSNIALSSVFGIVVNAVKYAVTVMPSLRSWFGQVSSSRLKEFSGCSKSFLVHRPTTLAYA